MKQRHGFTIVELVIVMTIAVILLTVAVVATSRIQADSRNKERQADVESIVQALESHYTREIRDNAGNLIKHAGSYYPLAGTSTTGFSVPEQLFSEVMSSSLKAPGQSTVSLSTVSGAVCGSGSTASRCNINASTLANQLSLDGLVNTNSYIYYPVTGAGNILCTVQYGNNSSNPGCRQFRIYYATEGVSGAMEMKMVEGKRK